MAQQLEKIRPSETMRSFGAIHSANTTNSSTDTTNSSTDTRNSSIDTGGFHMSKSPLEAVLLSTAVPGLGQVYLGQAWKLPILYGIGGAFLYGALIQNFRYHYTLDSINNELARKDSKDSVTASILIGNNLGFYVNDRDKWWIYLALTYLANIFDAYIGANLYDFDVSDPAPSPSSFQSYYDPVDKSVGLSFTIKF